MIGIDGYRCVRFKPDEKIIYSGKFDLQNPCSWCGNRIQVGRSGPAFFYMENGQWEFPFIAEANCNNFSLILKPGIDKPINNNLLNFASEFQKNRNRIAQIGDKYGIQWSAFKKEDISRFMGLELKEGEIYYPNNFSAIDFYREVSNLKSDFFEIRYELNEAAKRFNKIRDRNIESMLINTEKMMENCMRQTEELEKIKNKTSISIFSNWSFNSVTGKIAFDSIKSIGKVISRLIGFTF